MAVISHLLGCQYIWVLHDLVIPIRWAGKTPTEKDRQSPKFSGRPTVIKSLYSQNNRRHGSRYIQRFSGSEPLK
jgi:hypothetical protein